MNDDLKVLLVIANVGCLVWNVYMLLQVGALWGVHLGLACLNSYAIYKLEEK